MSGLSQAERELYGALVAAIARGMASRHSTMEGAHGLALEPRDARAGDAFFHQFTSTFERACEVLWNTQVAEPVPGTDGIVEQCPAVFTLTVDAKNIAGYVGRNDAWDRVPIDIVLGAFIDCEAYFGFLETERVLFTPAIELANIMQLIAAADYAKTLNGQYFWAEKAAPAMKSIWAWSSHDDGEESTEQESLDLEADGAIKTMPFGIWETIVERPNDIIGLTTIVQSFWRDGRWHEAMETETKLRSRRHSILLDC